MIRSTARVETDRADRYLTQLCRHFAHKVPADSDGRRGRADFGWGVCTLTATADALLLDAEAEDAAGLDRVEFVVRDHAERFGARDGLAVTWHRQTA